MKRPFSIYCDWSMHDELGDAVELDEAMTLRALDTLERWQQEFDFFFDYYLLDAFWFAPDQPYTAFKRPHWPQGFERTRQRIADLHMLPGLWYDVNASLLKPVAWSASLDTAGRAHSLAEGPYRDGLEAAWQFAIEEWGVRLFKLDFANFYTQAAGSTLSAEENYTCSVESLRAILKRLRGAHPDLAVIAYNGMERWPGYLGSPLGMQLQQGFDLGWLDACDYLYSGDPRPGDTPRTDLRRSIDLFQDHQVWQMAQNHFPLELIDDHGCMVGSTNTAFYQGNHGIERTWLASLARGGQRVIYYGDPALATADQVRFLAGSRKLYFNAYCQGSTTCLLGGEPGISQWHGSLTGGASAGLLYLVNASCSSQQIELSLPGLRRACTLFADGPLGVPLAVGAERLTVQLLPEQMAVIGLGDYAERCLHLEHSVASPQPVSMQPLAITWEWVDANTLRANYVGPWTRQAKLLVYAQAFGHPQATPWKLAGSELPGRFGQEMTKKGERPVSSVAHQQVAITASTSQRILEPAGEMPGVPIWAGISWVGRYFEVDSEAALSGITLHIRQNLTPRREIVPHAYIVMFSQDQEPG